MSPWRRPSLLGALLWIGLGVLFLLRNFNIGPDFWSLAGHYWPVLLILLGLGKVLEYVLHKDSISLRFGEIFGIILLILIGSAVSRLSQSHLGQIIRNLPIERSGETHTFIEEATYSLPNSLPIRIENSRGSVSITPGGEHEIRVRLIKVIYANEARARDIAPQIHLEAKPELTNPSTTAVKAEAEPGNEKSAEYFVLRTNRDSLSSQDFTFDTNLEVLVPKNSQIQVRNSIGEIRVSEIIGNMDLSTTHRDIEVRDCTGQLKITTGYAECRLTNLVGNVNVDSRGKGKVYINGIRGDVAVTDEYSPLEIIDVDGRVQASNNEGRIRIENITKPVIVDSRGTEVYVENLQDSLKISASHKNVDISDVASNVVVESSYASISLKRIKGNLDIRSNSDFIDADDIRGGLKLRARGSGVRVNEIAGPLDIQTSLKDVTVNNFSDSCSITNEYAGISASSRNLGKGNVILRNRNGDVELFIPENASFAIDATARNGKVESDYGGLKPRNDDDSGTLKSRIGTGGPNISLETNYGSIRIHPSQGQTEKQSMENNRGNKNPAVRSLDAIVSDFRPGWLSRYIVGCIRDLRLSRIAL